MKLGATCKRLRQLKGLKQVEVSAVMDGYDPTSLSRFENDKQPLNTDKLEQLAQALGMRISEIYAAAEAGKPPMILSDDERKLIEIYRSLNPYQQATAPGLLSALGLNPSVKMEVSSDFDGYKNAGSEKADSKG